MEINVSHLVQLSQQKFTLIKDHIYQTPLLFSASLSQKYNCQVFVKAGHLLQEFRNEDTCCDAIAGSIEPEAITFPLCQQLVDEYICVEDEPILKAVEQINHHHQMIVESSSAITLACLEAVGDLLQGKTVVLVLSGSNTT